MALEPAAARRFCLTLSEDHLSNVPLALVVDDDFLIRMDVLVMLEDAGFRALEAEDAEAAMEVLRARDGDIMLLFTDVQMPGATDGFGLARAVAARWPETWIVVSSGARSPAAGDLPPRATFINKPFSAEVVHAELRRLLPDGKKPEPLRRAM